MCAINAIALDILPENVLREVEDLVVEAVVEEEDVERVNATNVMDMGISLVNVEKNKTGATVAMVLATYQEIVNKVLMDLRATTATSPGILPENVQNRRMDLVADLEAHATTATKQGT